MVALLLAGDTTLDDAPARARPPATEPVPSPPAATPTPTAPAPAPPTQSVAAAGARAPASAPPHAAPSAPWAFSAEGGPAAALGLLPGLASGADARFWATPGRGPGLFVAGSLWRSQRAQTGQTSGADLDLWMAGLGICPFAPRAGTRAFTACVVGDITRRGAAGFGFGQTITVRRWEGDVGVEADARQRLWAKVFLSLGVRAVAPLARHRVVYQDSAGVTQSLYRVAPVALVAGLRVGVVFP
jgi:hypothetical protein